jgi:hypothetical protein
MGGGYSQVIRQQRSDADAAEGAFGHRMPRRECHSLLPLSALFGSLMFRTSPR